MCVDNNYYFNTLIKKLLPAHAKYQTCEVFIILPF